MNALVRCAVVAGILAGCARSGTASSPAQEIDPCTLLSRAEAGAILKRPPGEPRRDGDRCTWMADPANIVTIEAHATGGGTLMAGARAGAGLIGAVASNVTGVGDEAFYGAGDSVLYVREADRYVEVDLRGVQRPRAVGPALARAVLAHLR